jgi:hypothetical protein
MKDIKIIALDMDGVVNSSKLIQKWIDDKWKIEEQNPNNLTDEDVRLAVRKAYQEEFVHCEELIFPELAERITKIVNETDCYIIWSSTWRRLERYIDIENAREMFNRRGLPGDRLIAYTPMVGMSWGGRCRGAEIKSWIKNNEEYNVIKCAVIDDRCDAGECLPDNALYFWIDSYTGITDNDVINIINYLKG